MKDSRLKRINFTNYIQEFKLDAISELPDYICRLRLEVGIVISCSYYCNVQSTLWHVGFTSLIFIIICQNAFNVIAVIRYMIVVQ